MTAGRIPSELNIYVREKNDDACDNGQEGSLDLYQMNDDDKEGNRKMNTVQIKRIDKNTEEDEKMTMIMR